MPTRAATLHAVLPDAVRDPGRPSGGNTYDRRVLDGLTTLGRDVHEHLVGGRWPEPDAPARRSLADAVGRVPDGASVLVDGLLASRSPATLVPLARRASVVVLVHLPLGGDPEREVLAAAAAVVTTSPWSRERLLALHGLDPGRVHVAEPGTDPAPVAPGTPGGGSLLFVGAVTALKGVDVLADALGRLPGLSWRCVVAGSPEVEPSFADAVRTTTRRAGLADRVELVGPLGPAALADAYARADLLVAPSRLETFGMAVADALARGLPVVAGDVGGLPRTLRGPGPAGTGLPGALVPAGDPAALALVLRSWLTDADVRRRWRAAAARRREGLAPWAATVRDLEAVLGAFAPPTGGAGPPRA